MTNTTKSSGETRVANREEKIEEILAILGDLFQRFGMHQAAPANVAMATPDYKFVGYRPYGQAPVLPAATVPWPTPYGTSEMARSGSFLPF